MAISARMAAFRHQTWPVKLGSVGGGLRSAVSGLRANHTREARMWRG